MDMWKLHRIARWMQWSYSRASTLCFLLWCAWGPSYSERSKLLVKRSELWATPARTLFKEGRDKLSMAIASVDETSLQSLVVAKDPSCPKYPPASHYNIPPSLI